MYKFEHWIKFMVLSSLYQTIKKIDDSSRFLLHKSLGTQLTDIGIKNNQQFFSSVKGAANLPFTNNWWKFSSLWQTGWFCVVCLQSLWFYPIARGINLVKFLLMEEEDRLDCLRSWCHFSRKSVLLSWESLSMLKTGHCLYKVLSVQRMQEQNAHLPRDRRISKSKWGSFLYK